MFRFSCYSKKISEDAEGNEFVEEEVVPQLRGEVAHIVDFRAPNTNNQNSDYTFNSVISTHAGKYIDQIWAGPCHWKLKFMQRGSTRFSGARKETVVTHRRKKAEPNPIDYDEDIVISNKHLVIKKKPPSVDINK